MSRARWHVLREGPVLTLARALPPRFDVVAETWLPGGGRARLAHQIRQDIWRAVQHQRGFSPVVQIACRDGGLAVRAGGRVSVRPFDRDGIEARIADVLEHKKCRARWIRCAGRAA
ncbi:hypothetical protein [Tropicimonas isoalkanivorans]|uniref:Uncharacterized protein n=1 Tax=Tropicimonas isoalkanivorans TaxID=441112 RepID=A0A1I1JFG1_9RHOB|nr:hypothetical protein [Tropicimonas isoalkanivorans]SFC47264.1 hypothetical protein SAMN04488094_105100 [Tropicimonas isoalkanivorans]